MTMDDIDITLMLGVKAGDIQCFEQLFAKHQKSVLNVIYRYVGNAHLAEDLTQETFFRVYKARESYQADAKFTTYLYRIVTNLCINELKRRKPLYSLDSSPEHTDNIPAPELHSTEDPELTQRVKAVIAGLLPNQRMAVVLNKYEKLSYQEIAERMDISVKAVKSLLARARTNIKEQLEPYINPVRDIQGKL